MAWPTTNDHRSEFVTVRFTKGEAAELDVLAALVGGRSGRSEVIRDAVATKAKAHKRSLARAAKQKEAA